MNGKTLIKSLVLLLLVIVPLGTAFAGGWATVTLDEPPQEVHAGEVWKLGFVVRQHGEKPTHFLVQNGDPIEPYLAAENLATGEKLRLNAIRGMKPGHFTLDVVFTSEGKWEWSIVPFPLTGVTEFSPIEILPAPSKVVLKADESGEPLGAKSVSIESGIVIDLVDQETNYARTALTIAAIIFIGASLGLLTLLLMHKRKRTNGLVEGRKTALD